MRDERMKEMEAAAATYLRKMWLGIQTRKQYLRLQEDFRKAEGSVITMQRYIRGCLCRLWLWREAVANEQEVWAAIEIQRHWRGYKGRVHAENAWEQVWRREMAAALLQRNLRGWVVRAKIARQRWPFWRRTAGGSWRVPASKRPRDDFWEPNVFRPVYEESWRVRPCMHGWHLPPTQQCVSKAYIEVEWFGRACGLRFAYSA